MDLDSLSEGPAGSIVVGKEVTTSDATVEPTIVSDALTRELLSPAFPVGYDDVDDLNMPPQSQAAPTVFANVANVEMEMSKESQPPQQPMPQQQQQEQQHHQQQHSQRAEDEDEYGFEEPEMELQPIQQQQEQEQQQQQQEQEQQPTLHQIALHNSSLDGIIVTPGWHDDALQHDTDSLAGDTAIAETILPTASGNLSIDGMHAHDATSALADTVAVDQGHFVDDSILRRKSPLTLGGVSAGAAAGDVVGAVDDA